MLLVLPSQSVFRERIQGDSDNDLSDDFLEEMDREQNALKERQYIELLRRLWQKYKASDKDLERLILQREFEREDDDDIFDDFSDKKKRTLYSPMVGYPSPMMMGYYDNVAFDKKKRGYPVLPWLPASRKKRFPIVLTKRSSVSAKTPSLSSEKSSVSTVTMIHSDHEKLDLTTSAPTNSNINNKSAVQVINKNDKQDSNNVEETMAKKKKKTLPIKKVKVGEQSVEKKKPSRVVVKKRDVHDDLLEGFEDLWMNEAKKKRKRQLGEECDDEEECGESHPIS